VLIWRFFTGQPLVGVTRTDAGWFTRGHKTLDRDSAPKPPGTLVGEVGRDMRNLRAEWGELRVRRALGRELKDVERQVLCEDDPG
jgi:hypothetical protein